MLAAAIIDSRVDVMRGPYFPLIGMSGSRQIRMVATCGGTGHDAQIDSVETSSWSGGRTWQHPVNRGSGRRRAARFPALSGGGTP